MTIITAELVQTLLDEDKKHGTKPSRLSNATSAIAQAFLDKCAENQRLQAVVDKQSKVLGIINQHRDRVIKSHYNVDAVMECIEKMALSLALTATDKEPHKILTDCGIEKITNCIFTQGEKVWVFDNNGVPQRVENDGEKPDE